MKTALLTVGSTQFAPFVMAALQEDTLKALAEQGYTRFIVQYGKQERPMQPPVRSIQVELHAFMADIEEKMQQVDLILSHAGAGSILAALRGPALSPSTAPKKLIIVPNDTLMDAHQSELADEMVKQGWASVASPSTLAQVIRSVSIDGILGEPGAKTAFPAFDGSKIRGILDETLGYA